MIDIKTLLSKSDDDIIGGLKEKSLDIIGWDALVKDYEPKLHHIVDDKQGRRDKVHSDGTKDRAARLTIGLEKLLVKRYADFTFALPVKRVYSNLDNNQTRKDIAFAIEQIYNKARINFLNLKRAENYYAACETLSIWYVVKEDNTMYGFASKYKMKCKTYSPMDGTDIYPMFDERGDMVALSFGYKRKGNDETTEFFEVFTADKHIKWQATKGEWERVKEDELPIGKIPAVYLYRPRPVWDGLQPFREDLEYTLSRNSDVIGYNSAPILKVSGSIIGEENKGETRRVYRVSEGGDVSYVSWNQSVEATSQHMAMLLKFFFMQAQMPDISFDAMRSLGNIGYDARKLMFSDAHLRINAESGAWCEMLDRECNVIKAFLKKLNTAWAKEIDNVVMEHIITPFFISDEAAEVDKWLKASGGKQLVSQKEAIGYLGVSDNPEETMRQILNEQQQLADTQMKATLQQQDARLWQD